MYYNNRLLLTLKKMKQSILSTLSTLELNDIRFNTDSAF